jgi:acyl-coenzyme A thioesterase PaaI-like protein
MDDKKTRIPQLEGQSCFACGTANPIGLKLKFYRLGDAICTDIRLDKLYEGWTSMAHGGIISTLLGETMSWTILYFRRVFFVTRKMEVKFVRPILVERPLTVQGRLLESPENTRIRARADIVDSQGNILARGTGEFVVVPEEKFSSVPEDMKREMIALFERFPPA